MDATMDYDITSLSELTIQLEAYLNQIIQEQQKALFEEQNRSGEDGATMGGPTG